MANKGRYSFKYTGGVSKAEGTSSKFLLFHLLPGEDGKCTERILYQSFKEGLIIKADEAGDQYYTEYPLFKLFTLVEGFGIQRFFYSFYVKLDGYGKNIVIRPLDKSKRLSQLFLFTGRILQAAEVKELIGEDSISWKFYERQVPLPVPLLKDIVSISSEGLPLAAVASDVRTIKF